MTVLRNRAGPTRIWRTLSFKVTSYGQRGNYAADFEENIRIVENYKNIRDLHTTESSQDHNPGDEQIRVRKEVERSKENERKKEKIFNAES
jgi:hypothetical protein